MLIYPPTIFGKNQALFYRLAGILAAAIGAVALVGWVFGISWLKSVLPGAVEMTGFNRPAAVTSKVLSAFIGTLCILLLMGGYTYQSSVAFKDSTAWVAHTQEVLAAVGHLYASVADAESAQRAYVLTGAPARLDDYVSFAAETDKALQKLKILIADNPVQSARLTELGGMIHRRLEILDQVRGVYERQGLDAARAAVTSGRGIETMQTIRSLVQKMEANEEDLLRERQAVADQRQHQTLIALLLTLAAAAAGMGILYRGIRREADIREEAEQALRTSEENLAVTLHSIGDAVLATDAQGRVTRLNTVAEALTGWTLAEALGRPVGEIFRIINETTRESAVVPVENVMRTGEIHGLANHTVLIARDGSEHPIADSAAPIRDRQGNLIGVVLVFRDIREERAALLALRKSEERVRLATEAACFGVWELDIKSDTIEWDERMFEIYGLPPKPEGRGAYEDWRARVLPAEIQEQEAQLQTTVAACDRGQREFRIVRASDQAVRVIQTSEVAVAGPDGQAARLIGITRDITDLKRAQEAAAQLAAIVTSSQDAIIGKDLHGIVTSWNPGAEMIFGYSASEMIGHSIIRIIPPEHQEEESKIRGRIALGESVPPFETVRMRKDGSTVDILMTESPIKDPAGRIVGASKVAHDITGRKRAEEAIQRLNTELQQRAADLEEARRAAEQANRAKSEFLSRMSHELRTPLNAILGFGQLLEMNADNGDRESVEHILKAGRHLLDLINEVLDISRIEAGRMSISREPVLLNCLLAECVQLIRPLANERRIRFEGDFATDCERHVMADHQRLKQVLLNLLSNAVKYNREGGIVSVSCETTEDEWVRIKIQDTGAGISQQDVARLFSPFERLDADLYGIEGTGLGLALSKHLIELMGGMIGAESVLGEGSLFWITLPPGEASIVAVERELIHIAEESPLADGAGRRHKTVLYIEDNLSNLRLIERILGQRPGVKLIAAMQGNLGLDLTRQHLPDLILLDLDLPDIPGREVLHRLRAEPAARRIPVVIISAEASAGEIERLRAAGANDYLTKPFDVRNFLKVLDENLKEEGSEPCR